MQKYATVVVRIGMSLVFLWFGTSQLMNPTQWFGFLPDWTANLPISQTMFIYGNAGFEIFFGIFLLLGLFTRISALLLALHMVGILSAVFSTGASATFVRDFGLLCATFSIFLSGPDILTLDWRKNPSRIGVDSPSN